MLVRIIHEMPITLDAQVYSMQKIEYRIYSFCSPGTYFF